MYKFCLSTFASFCLYFFTPSPWGPPPSPSPPAEEKEGKEDYTGVHTHALLCMCNLSSTLKPKSLPRS